MPVLPVMPGMTVMLVMRPLLAPLRPLSTLATLLAAAALALAGPVAAQSPAPPGLQAGPQAAPPGSPAASPAAKPAGRPGLVDLRAIHFGDTLFDFYQQRHFEALAGLMASQHFGRIAPNGPDAELLRGGMLLSWGLHEEATAVLTALLTEAQAPAIRDRAWLQLAKIRYQRGHAAAAEQALNEVGTTLPPEQHEERVLLQARILMARGEHDIAATFLKGLPLANSATARFNLGVALIKSGDRPQGIAILDEIGQIVTVEEELLALRDRANLALGYDALGAKLPADARRFLQRIRLVGPDSGKALLAYGWAALEQGEPRHALVPWGELLARPVSDPAAVEAQLAVPYALSEAGAASAAKERYEVALSAFAEERLQLNESIAAIRAGRLLLPMLESNPEFGRGWLGGVEQLPAMNYAGHLSPIIASHEFQESFKSLQDLAFVHRHLLDWQEKLELYTHAQAQRHKLAAERVPQLREAAGATQLEALRQRYQATSQALQRALAVDDLSAYGSALEHGWPQRLGQLGSAIQALPTAVAADPTAAGVSSAEQAAMAERVRRLQGAVLWQQSEQASQRSWDARKHLSGLEPLLAQAGVRDARVQRLAAAEPGRISALAQRMAALATRVQSLQPRLAALSAEQLNHLQDLTVAELLVQRDRLDAYATQARLGIAQVLDRAQLIDGMGGGTNTPNSAPNNTPSGNPAGGVGPRPPTGAQAPRVGGQP